MSISPSNTLLLSRALNGNPQVAGLRLELPHRPFERADANRREASGFARYSLGLAPHRERPGAGYHDRARGHRGRGWRGGFAGCRFASSRAALRAAPG